MKKNRSFGRALLLGPHTLWCILFIIVPMIFVVYYTFTTVDGGFTLDNIKFIADPENGYV